MGFVDDFDREMNAQLARWRAADVAESQRRMAGRPRDVVAGLAGTMDQELAFWTDPQVRDARLREAGGHSEADVLAAVRAPFGHKPQRFMSETDVVVARTFGRITDAEAQQKLRELREAAAGTAGRVTVQESTAGAATLVGGRRIRVTLITPGHGSSGYYPAATLEAAARDKVFPEGLPIYLDHPSSREAHERPERSVRDLAGLLVEDAKWTGAALVAEARVVPAHADLVTSLEGIAGMSIRAQGEAEPATVDGQRVRKITKLVAAESVDVVTKAGRGGRFEVLEGNRR